MDSIGIIWSPACSLFHEIAMEMKNHAKVLETQTYDLGAKVRTFIYHVYEGGSRTVLESKIRSIEQCSSHQVCIVKLIIPEELGWDERKCCYYNVNAKKLKTSIREKYREKIQGYCYDNLFHLTVTEEEYIIAARAVEKISACAAGCPLP